MYIALGFGCMVALAVTAGGTGIPKKRHSSNGQFPDFEDFQVDHHERQDNGKKDCYINGTKYQCGSGDYVRNCASFECHCDGKWWTSDKYRLLTCRECLLHDDPHITTFDGARYDWHRDCTYILAEEEEGNSYVYGKFTECWPGSIASCVDDITFKPRVGPIVTITNPNKVLTVDSPYNAKVVINGYSQSITTPDRQMQVLRGPENHEHPVLAYYTGGCLHIIALDEQDFLVKLCWWSVRIFAARKKFTSRNILGMCGNPDDGTAGTDLKLRNGTIIDNPGGCCFDHIVDPTFAKDWEVPSKPCLDTSGKKRSTLKSGMKICKASEDQKAEFISICKNLIGIETSLSDKLKHELIDTCGFDQCIITQAGADNDTINEWLLQYTNLTQQEVFQQEHEDDTPEDEYEYIDYLADYYNDRTTESENEETTMSNNKETTTMNPGHCQGDSGFRGMCFGTQQNLKNYSRCDSFIQNAPGCPEGETCCVDCSQQSDLCDSNWQNSVARNIYDSDNHCCRNERKVGEARPGSGCTCCIHCKPEIECKNKRGRCVTEMDPVLNFQWCNVTKNGTLHAAWCKGDLCSCCIWDRTN